MTENCAFKRKNGQHNLLSNYRDICGRYLMAEDFLIETNLVASHEQSLLILRRFQIYQSYGIFST